MKKDNSHTFFENSQPLLSNKTTFSDCYPYVIQLDLEVRAMPMGFGQTQEYHYSLNNPPRTFCACPNSRCSQGGFNISSFLYDLISKRAPSGEASCRCEGYEKINRKYSRSCFYHFSAKATLKYSDKQSVE